MSQLGWYQLEGEWSFEESDGILIGYANGEGEHDFVLADADGKPVSTPRSVFSTGNER